MVEKRVETKRPPAIKAVMCTLPDDNTTLWGDNVVYKEKVRQSLAECNDKNQRANEMNMRLYPHYGDTQPAVNPLQASLTSFGD
ncbi:hypothetical protein ACR71G_03505 [Xenorhabdus bovienii]|uniref:hypothetical protein n=1 Tax=Xenorhabdus bovienii TaxID=40576 RepID=UPI003DA4534C